MNLSNEHLTVLKDMAVFSKVRRYRGMLPHNVSIFYDEAVINDLVQNEYVERIQVSFSCGSERVLLKPTKKGLDAAEKLRQADTETDKEKKIRELRALLTEEQFDILNDVHHYSHIRRHNGMMPMEKLEIYDTKSVNELYGQGFIIKVKAEPGTGKKRKGYILSEKGIAVLHSVM